jgi:OmpA-OmpF porin, OOP family
MFSIAHATMVSAVILGLAACASPTITALENAPPPANPFAHALSQEYLAFARIEKAEMFDLKDFPYFAEKGLAVATNSAQDATPGPVDPADWDLSTERQRRLHNARNRLASRLSNGADDDAPTLAADAQVSFDCWVEQAEEGDQPTHIAACRDQFNSAMARADAPSGPPRAVFFAHDSAALDANARKTITAMASKAIHLSAPRVTIQGHADQSGAAAHNLRLSLRRADTVRAVLIEAGFPAARIAVSAAGESRPRTATPNNAPLRENRRVELIFQPYETW